jgi:Leucine-rich repeat (LRR) protein
MWSLPTELAAESDLKRLDLSDNPLQQLQLQHLPANLQELVLAGCHLHGAVPSNLNQLTALEQLVLSANSITSADAVFSCPQLVHVGLAYNHLSTLTSTSPAAADAREGRARCHSSSTTAGNLIRTSITTASKAGSISSAVPAAHGAPASAAYASRKTSSAATTSSISGIKACSNPGVLASCNIMSLDLSHNHITDLPLILQELQQLPKLRALHLQGNPISLLPHYKASVLQQLPLLIYLDGQVCSARFATNCTPCMQFLVAVDL